MNNIIDENKIFTDRYKLKCDNCNYTFVDYMKQRKFKIGDVFSDTDCQTIVLKCPKCDNDWENNCGVDFEAYPSIKNEIVKYL